MTQERRRERVDSVYTAWKGWDEPGAFAAVERGDDAYFRSELREVCRFTEVSDVLEVGFGNGQFLGYCRRQGWNVTGTELLPELVGTARDAGFTALAAHDLPGLPDASFDLIAGWDVLEHIPPDQSVPFLQELRSKLRPHGALLLRFPNADSWLGNAFQNGDPTHVNAIGAHKLTYYAHEAGMTIVRFRGARRRGFETSVIHGVHRMTAGVYAEVAGTLRRAIYFPALKVVLSTSDVVCVLSPE
ncbi:class I SAM-dependent methyltransferase [uncultured Cellulomonas sp.]|uniref:class I SAM-dependent methyltransferase n=1 Tax=uncultured Cellulomonas sp. TaxID=189682 RepID=UPI0028ED1472|nr:class I SAM-dependent methyltransferase [uncultured Cellulomonas sp.]